MSVTKTVTAFVESGRADVTARVAVRLWPGEPMVRYYPDGSGYPGSPPEAEIEEIEVRSVTYFNADGTVRADYTDDDIREDWALWLDSWFRKHCNESDICEEAAELAAEEGYPHEFT